MADLYVKPSKDMFATEERDLDEILETFTLGKVLGRFKGESKTRYNYCDNEFYGLHFDLPSNDVLEHGQILVVLYNVKLRNLQKWTSGKVDISVWPHVSVWGNERGKHVGRALVTLVFSHNFRFARNIPSRRTHPSPSCCRPLSVWVRH